MKNTKRNYAGTMRRTKTVNLGISVTLPMGKQSLESLRILLILKKFSLQISISTTKTAIKIILEVTASEEDLIKASIISNSAEDSRTDVEEEDSTLKEEEDTIEVTMTTILEVVLIALLDKITKPSNVSSLKQLETVNLVTSVLLPTAMNSSECLFSSPVV